MNFADLSLRPQSSSGFSLSNKSVGGKSVGKRYGVLTQNSFRFIDELASLYGTRKYPSTEWILVRRGRRPAGGISNLRLLFRQASRCHLNLSHCFCSYGETPLRSLRHPKKRFLPARRSHISGSRSQACSLTAALLPQ